MKQTQTTEQQKAISLTEWLTGTPELLKLGFTEAEIEKAILDSGNSVDTLTEIKGYQSLPQWMKKYEVVQERGYRYFVEVFHPNGGDWKKTEWKTGIGVRQTAQYQGLNHGAILFALFSNKWAWFDTFKNKEECSIKKFLSDLPISQIPAEFQNLTPSELRREYLIQKEVKECSQWKIYEMREDGEIYLETAAGSLYVPVKALTNNDFSAIEKRMREYLGWYYKVDLSGYALNHRGRTEAQYLIEQAEQQQKNLAALESPEAIQLKKYLSK
jgi:hypothetical protein